METVAIHSLQGWLDHTSILNLVEREMMQVGMMKERDAEHLKRRYEETTMLMSTYDDFEELIN